jgi:Domain of unknown function (DUF4157)
MKPTQTRRFRRRSTPSRSEGTFFKKESQQEQSFFGETTHDSFFPPVAAPTQNVQRKCAECEKEEKKVHRMENKKEEDKKLMREEDKKEEDSIQKKEDSKEEKEKLQKKEAGTTSASSPGVSNYISSISSKGNPLSAQANHFFSSRMGYDFSKVKIHTGKDAADSAKDINAKAYTVGNNIVFNEGQFNTESVEGKKLMAHELTHVVQQNDGLVNRLQMKKENDAEPSGQFIDQQNATSEANANEELLNEPVPVSDISTKGRPSRETVFGKSVRFEGKTDAEFDGGRGQTKDLKGVKANDCKGCSGNECLTITGTFEITYTVTTSVKLPSVPEGLTPCQQAVVKDAIDNKIAPHEQEHVSAFNSYNGIVQLPINYTGCKDGLLQYLQDINDSDGIIRKAAAKDKSSALDPFYVDVDLDCKEPETPPK